MTRQRPASPRNMGKRAFSDDLGDNSEMKVCLLIILIIIPEVKVSVVNSTLLNPPACLILKNPLLLTSC
jgi:hypothetical protein